jgi:hypothetical protein
MNRRTLVLDTEQRQEDREEQEDNTAPNIHRYPLLDGRQNARDQKYEGDI